MVDHEQVRRDHGYHRLAVKRVVEETADARSFVLEVPDELRDAFAYRPGQFCTFRVTVGDDQLLRCYSMSSAPETDPDLTVTVKRVRDGRVSNWFNDEVHEGDVLEVTRPAGVFCAREGEARPVVAFCGGSGVTPVMSILKSVLAGTDRSVAVLYANRDRTSVIFDADLSRLAEAHPDRLEVRHHLDADGGFLTAADVTAFADGRLHGDFYICGPGPFMDLVERSLLDAGVDLDRIFIERFVVEGEPLPEPAAGGDDGAAANDDSDEAVPAEVTIVLGGKRTTVAYQAGDTILQTARRGGLSPPFSCEAGNCATCMAMLHQGAVTMRTNNALTPEEVEEGWVLTCQSIPRGTTVEVEYESF